MAHQSIIQFPLSTLLFMNKAPRLLHLRQQDATQSEPRTMVPYLEVLILFQPLYTQSNGLLIPENHIVFKSANTNLTPPDTPMSWILQNIKRSIKVMYRGSAKGKPWWISKSTGCIYFHSKSTNQMKICWAKPTYTCICSFKTKCCSSVSWLWWNCFCPHCQVTISQEDPWDVFCFFSRCSWPPRV